MMKKWMASGATALALVLAAGTFEAAEAHRAGGYRAGPHFVARPFAAGRYVGRPSYAAPYVHRRHFRRGFIGVPFAYGAYYYGDYYYGGSCRWLRHRALETGSRYWWARYYDCINGYY